MVVTCPELTFIDRYKVNKIVITTLLPLQGVRDADEQLLDTRVFLATPNESTVDVLIEALERRRQLVNEKEIKGQGLTRSAKKLWQTTPELKKLLESMTTLL